MKKMSLVTAQRLLMGIISSVEGGFTTPSEAAVELAGLKKQAPEGFEADYSVGDFERLREDYLSRYEEDADGFEFEISDEDFED